MTIILTQKKEITVGTATDALRPDKAMAAVEKMVGKKGHIWTIPDIVDNRLYAPFDDPAWTNWFTGMAEEDHGTDNKGNKVYMVAIGEKSMALNNSERIKRAYDKNEFLNYGFAKLDPEEFARLLKYAVPLEEIKEGNLTLPESYIIVEKVDKMVFNKRGYVPIGKKAKQDRWKDTLRTDDRFLMIVGSEERRTKLLDKIESKWDTYGNFHRISDVDYSVPQGRLVQANVNNFGFNGCNGIYLNARLVGGSAGGAVAQKITHKEFLENRVANAYNKRNDILTNDGRYIFISNERLEK